MAGFLDSIKNWFRPEIAPNGQQIVWNDEAIHLIEGMTPDELWRTQPYLRTVVTFIARNIAHLGLHTYARVSDTDRRRVKDDPLARLLSRPNPHTTTFELINATVSDLKLHDVAYWHLSESADSDSGWELWNIPASWVVGKAGGNAFAPKHYIVHQPGAQQPTRIKAADVLAFHGWNPGRPDSGSSPVDALRGLLIEQISAQTYRTQVWQRGGRVGTYITRPVGAPVWAPEDKERFRRGWNAKFSGNNGPQAGETPVLGDGMEVKRIGFSAKEDEWAEVAKLSLAMVASVYHVNPTMVGLLDNANYSNTKEFRKMLYGDTLGPDIAMLEDRINTFLVPRVSPDSDVYVEFNIQEKLQGSFEEQAEHLRAAIGAPYMTRAEGRARMNLPEIEGADELVVPLNLGMPAGSGGEMSADELTRRIDSATSLIRAGFSPVDSLVAVGLDPIEHLGLLPVTVQRPANPDGTVDDVLVEQLESGEKAAARLALDPAPSSKAAGDAPGVDDADESEPYDAEHVTDVFVAYFERQARVISTTLGAKASDPEWWDAARWDAELAADLFKIAEQVTAIVGRRTAASLGYAHEDYDVDRTVAFLRTVADRRAGMVNETTRLRIEELIADGHSTAEAVDVALKEARDLRAPIAALTVLAVLHAWPKAEAAEQIGRTHDRKAVKTWRTTSKNPRPTHAAVNGETVPIGEKFSNGMQWPGDSSGGVDEVAGCQCDIEVSFDDPNN